MNTQQWKEATTMHGRRKSGKMQCFSERESFCQVAPKYQSLCSHFCTIRSRSRT